LKNARYIDTTNIRHKSDQKGKIRKLKDLVKEYLCLEIQDGTHSSVVDAKAAMALFLHFKDSKEAFYGDNTIQEMDASEKPMVKKRVRKIHRKEMLKLLKPAPKPESFVSWAAKMALYGFSIYSV
jgi:hypothetical protein